MGGETCELCGYQGQPGTLEIHHIVPRELTAGAEMPDSATVKLCPRCHHEVHDWYEQKVFDKTYDTMTKRFQIKSPAAMAKEYEIAYRLFATYKLGQAKKA